MRRAALPLVAVLLLGAACGSGGGSRAAPPASPASSSATPSATPPTTPSPQETTPTCSPDGTTLDLTAKDVSFSKECLAVRAGTAFTIVFTNKDGVAHNVDITLEDGTSVFKGDLVTGKTVTYRVRALAAGVYPFQCDIHLSIMRGTFVVK